MKRAIFVILPVILISVTPLRAFSETVDEQTIDIRTREIAKTLRCTVCQTESIWESGAELARQMRAVVRERVAQGQSDEEIRAYFLSRYGDYILLQPRKRGLNWLIWGGPFLVLIVGGALLLTTIRRWVGRAHASSEEVQPLDENARRRIERELRSLE
jgi:cytochrome c-type biogenesis protein CcmH